MMRSPNKRRGKLEARFLGPYKVIKKEDSIYEIREVATGKMLQRHAESLKPYKAPAAPRVRQQRRQESQRAGTSAAAIRAKPARVSRKGQTGRRLTRTQSAILAMCIIGLFNPMQPVGALFQHEPHCVWTFADRTVWGGTKFFDILAVMEDPCDSLADRHDEYEHSSISLAYKAGGKTENQMLHSSMLAKCREMHQQIWVRAVNEMVGKCSSFDDTITPGGEGVTDSSEKRMDGVVYSRHGGRFCRCCNNRSGGRDLGLR